jgi:cysteinyl-tRNA synthetase
MHGNMLTFEGIKMSKSLGNSILPDELVSGNHKLLKKGFDPMVVRFFMLQAHYRSTLDFSNEALEASEKGYQRLMSAVGQIESLPASSTNEVDVNQFKADFEGAMNDDFNSPILIAHMFDAVKAINSVKDGKLKLGAPDKEQLIELMHAFVFDILGLKPSGQGSNRELVDGLMDVIIEMRTRARNSKDWETSDAIRDRLNGLSITVKDGKDGITWEVK